ncbi:MAG: HAD-IA family hydrolase [Janthinobacterium lividum]
MPSIQAIFFDIGDTLVFDDPPLLQRLASAANSAGITLDKARLPEAFRTAEIFAVRRYVSGLPWDEPGAMRETVSTLWEALQMPPLSDIHWAALAAAFTATSFTRYVHPNAIVLLEQLKRRGFLLGAVSDWEDTLPDVLTELRLDLYFDALSVSACVGATKPNPLIFQDALGQLDLLPEECLHVGDWLELDVAGARAAGIHPLLFDWAERCPDADCPRVTTFEQFTNYLLALPMPG